MLELEDADFDWMLGNGPDTNRGLRLPPGGADDPVTLAHVRAITRSLHAAGSRTSWMVVCDGELVGLCGFKRPPENGRVEVGYGLAASRRRLGFATRAVAAMLRVAAADERIEAVVAETVASNLASARVLEKNGFERTGARTDPLDGELVLWQATARPQSGTSVTPAPHAS
ncbi:MAG: GNAT family N-acetyltransferase [Vulcanimicrobiaceae bacterium]